MPEQHLPDRPPQRGSESAWPAGPTTGQGESPGFQSSGSAAGPLGLACPQCGECLGALTHRFSQPLTALRGTLELALRTELSAQEYRAALEQARELTDHIVYLLRSLRELADAATSGTPPQRLSLVKLAKETVEELRGLAESRRIRIIIEASLELIVRASPDRLREVILKILLLVIRRSPDRGEVRIAVSASGGSACFLIADEGPGPRPGEFTTDSAAASLGHLFAEAAKMRRLGWAVVRVLAESLGGTLQVKARNPQGCSFILHLPLAPDQQS